jgi:hypothetical protein
MSKVKINLTFMADLDPVEGAWNQPEDYMKFVRRVLTESHSLYNASVIIDKVETTQWHEVEVPTMSLGNIIARELDKKKETLVDDINRVTMIDPPSGWKYGFPKALPSHIDINDHSQIQAWLRSEGVPEDCRSNYRSWEE